MCCSQSRRSASSPAKAAEARVRTVICRSIARMQAERFLLSSFKEGFQLRRNTPTVLIFPSFFRFLSFCQFQWLLEPTLCVSHKERVTRLCSNARRDARDRQSMDRRCNSSSAVSSVAAQTDAGNRVLLPLRRCHSTQGTLRAACWQRFVFTDPLTKLRAKCKLCLQPVFS